MPEDVPPDIRGRRAEDGMLELRREYEQLLDEKGVLEEHCASLRRRQAQYLETIERQEITLAKVDHAARGKDVVRARDILAILDSVR